MATVSIDGRKILVVSGLLAKLLDSFLKPEEVLYGYFDYGFGWAVSGISSKPHREEPYCEIRIYNLWKLSLGMITWFHSEKPL